MHGNWFCKTVLQPNMAKIAVCCKSARKDPGERTDIVCQTTEILLVRNNVRRFGIGLATTQASAWQMFFACGKQKDVFETLRSKVCCACQTMFVK